jgi:hypothetical protein
MKIVVILLLVAYSARIGQGFYNWHWVYGGTISSGIITFLPMLLVVVSYVLVSPWLRGNKLLLDVTAE